MHKSNPNQNTHNYKTSFSHHGNGNHPPLSSTEKHPGVKQEHKMSTLRRACLVLENKLVAHGKTPPPQTNRTLMEEFDLQDTLFFTTAKTEFSVFVHSKSSHASAPSSPKLNPIRTRTDNDKNNCAFEKTRPNSTRAQKIYSNFRNLKQPISPGARLSTFISSIFVKDGKKKKKSSTCSSSASSLSKSNLSKSNSPISSSKKGTFSDGVKRTVRFCPSVSVILDHHDDHRENEKIQKQRKIEEVAFDLINGYWDPKMSKSYDQNVNHGTNHDLHEEDDDDDGLSCSSSDLFELDNLSLIRDELPVYETTQFDKRFL